MKAMKKKEWLYKQLRAGDEWVH